MECVYAVQAREPKKQATPSSFAATVSLVAAWESTLEPISKYLRTSNAVLKTPSNADLRKVKPRVFARFCLAFEALANFETGSSHATLVQTISSAQ